MANPSNKNYKERVASLIFVLSAAGMNLAEVHVHAQTISIRKGETVPAKKETENVCSKFDKRNNIREQNRH